MRMFLSVVAIFGALGLGALADPARGAAGNAAKTQPAASVVHVDASLSVDSSSASGAAFTAPQTGAYQVTIVSGSYCYLSLKDGETSPYGGWLTELQIYTKPVTWGAPDEWGKHPINADATVGDAKHHPTSAEAAAAGKGATVTLNLTKGTQVTLLVSDGSNFYADNKGVMKVRITADIAPAAPAATAAPPVPAKPVPYQGGAGTVKGGTTILLVPDNMP